MNDRRQKYLEQIPSLYRGIFKRAYAGRKTMKNAIHAKCLDCCCNDRKEVEHCEAVTCPLWDYRPYAETRFREKK